MPVAMITLPCDFVGPPFYLCYTFRKMMLGWTVSFGHQSLQIIVDKHQHQQAYAPYRGGKAKGRHVPFRARAYIGTEEPEQWYEEGQEGFPH